MHKIANVSLHGVLDICMRVCVSVFSSVFGALKGSCRAEGEEKITGADIICFCHVGLASGLTHCGLVRHRRQVYVPAHMLLHNECAYLTRCCVHADGHSWKRITYMHTEVDMLTHSAQKKSHTPTHSHTHTVNTQSSLRTKCHTEAGLALVSQFLSRSSPRQKMDRLLE